MGGQRHTPAALPRERDPVPIIQEAGWAPWLLWAGAENFAPTGIRSLDRPARSYPGPHGFVLHEINGYDWLIVISDSN